MGVMGQLKDRRFTFSIYLALGTFLVWLRVLRCGLVKYDDAVYTGHPLVKAGLTWPGIKWAFTGIHASNWHPLTTISHMLDSQIFGESAFGPHLVNLFLHIGSTVLLFLILSRITKSIWPSLFVAGLFAVHPLHVESVAWIAERKDVLSTFFWMLTMWAYVRYAEHPSQRRFLWVAGLYALGLMAKPMLVTLPFVLLLLDYWPLGRFGGSKFKVPGSRLIGLAQEKWPLFALAGISCVITYVVQHKGGAGVTLGQIPLGLRAENALMSYVTYMWKTVWPAGLAVFYPYPSKPPALWQPIFALAFLGGISGAVLWLRERRPYLLVGWFWFIGTLVPVIGLVQVGEQAMADRYTYIPLIGLFIMVAWGILGGRAELSTPNDKKRKGERGKGRKGDPAPVNHQPPTINHFRANTEHPTPNTALLVMGAVVFLALAVCTWRQIGFWQDRYTLFSHALEVTERNYVAHDMVGAELNDQGKHLDAIQHYSAAIQIKPNDDTAYNGLGNAFTYLGRYPEAVGAYDAAIRVRPGFPLAPFNEGIVLVLQGRVDEAIDKFQMVMKINKGARGHLEMFTDDQAKKDAQIVRAAAALRAMPNDPAAKCRYAIALVQRGRLEEAIDQLRAVADLGMDPEVLASKLRAAKTEGAPGQLPALQEAVRKKPDDPVAHFQLGNAYNNAGQRQQAVREFREAVRLNPDFARAHNNLAVALFFAGNYPEAWKEVHIAQEQGLKIHPGFLKALSERMSEPAQ